jgi:hypothetical protein
MTSAHPKPGSGVQQLRTEIVWLSRSLKALGPALRSLPEKVTLPPDVLTDLGPTAAALERLGRCLRSIGDRVDAA